jgi:hypothetical protein
MRERMSCRCGTYSDAGTSSGTKGSCRIAPPRSLQAKQTFRRHRPRDTIREAASTGLRRARGALMRYRFSTVRREARQPKLPFAPVTAQGTSRQKQQSAAPERMSPADAITRIVSAIMAPVAAPAPPYRICHSRPLKPWWLGRPREAAGGAGMSWSYPHAISIFAQRHHGHSRLLSGLRRSA